MKTLLLLLLSSTATIHSRRLSIQENSVLQATCGKKNGTRYETKIADGESTHAGDFPFAVAVNISGVLTGTVISPRHVILFNVVQQHEDERMSIFNDIPFKENATCEGNDMILPKDLHEIFEIDFVNRRWSEGPFAIERIIVFEGCLVLSTYLPMIFELKNDIRFDDNHRPACLSKYTGNWSPTDVMSVFGLGPAGHILTSAEFSPEGCTEQGLPTQVVCARPLNESQGLCAGDFGGGAVAEIDGRTTLMGIYAEGNDKCDKNPKEHEQPKFIDVAYYTSLFCKATGICVHAPQEPATSTESIEQLRRMTGNESSEEITEEVTEVPEETTTATTTSVPSKRLIETLTAEQFPKMKIEEASVNKSEEYSSHIKNIHVSIKLKEVDESS